MAFDYRKYPLPTAKSIRLLQIQPRKDGVDPFSDDIALRMRVVSLDKSELLPGVDSETAGRPTVRFDEEVTMRPQECFGVPRSERPQAKRESKLGRFMSKFKDKHDHHLVPVTEVPPGEPFKQDRFKWGNYVAMSYSWGFKEEWEMTEEELAEDSKKRAEDYEWDKLVSNNRNCDKHEVVLEGRRIGVRYSLWASLLAFREMKQFKEGIWLWNDALCINQTDEAEKKTQIKLMSDIYRQAGNIIVHIGNAYHQDEDTPWVLGYLQDISANYRIEYYEAMDHADPTVAHSHREIAKVRLERSATDFIKGFQSDIRTKMRQGDTDYAMVSIYDFFDRPYWRRLWIIQELAMGRPSMPIVIGDFVTQWRYVRDAALLLSMAGDVVRDAMQRALEGKGRRMTREPSFEHVASIAQLASFGFRKPLPECGEIMIPTVDHRWTKHNWKMQLTNITLPRFQTIQGSSVRQALTLAADADCWDPRDRVHGLLALPALSDLHVDVSMTTPLSDVYVRFTEACIKNGGNLDVFALVDGGDDATKQAVVPYWCPRFNGKAKIGRIEGDWQACPKEQKPNPNAWDLYAPDPAPRPEIVGKRLFCHGWVVDSVDGLGALNVSDLKGVKGRSLFKGEVIQPRFKPTWDLPEEIPKTIWKTLVGGTSINGKKAPDSFSCLLDSFPKDEPTDSITEEFLYRRNWNFLKANGDLPINGRKLSSHFNFQSKQRSAIGVPARTEEHDYHKICEAHRAMDARTRYRRLMTTSNKARLGLVPAATQQGDAVIILANHTRPLIATAVVPDGNSDDDWGGVTFKLKGEAYISGIMNGELAEELMETALNKFEFY